MAELDVHRYQHDVPKKLSDFDPKSFVNGVHEWVDNIVGPKERVAISVSGGVDSTVVAHLLKQRLENRLYLFFINDGFRRIIRGRPEYEVVAEVFRDFPNFDVIDEINGKKLRDLVLPWFNGVSNGTLKREIFRALYAIISNKYLAHISANWVADGTIAPDISMTEQKRQIQHNVALPYITKKLEPLASLYKPHVRKVAIYLDLPREFAMKIPCPGPAQLLRVGGRFNEDKLKISQVATDIVEQMVEKYYRERFGKYFKYDGETGVRTPFQYFATCLDSEMKPDPELSKKTGVECYRTGTDAMWVDTSVTKQERRFYAPIVWVRGPKMGHDALVELNKMISEQGLPRILYEVFDSGKPGYPVGIKVVESEDVRTAWPMDIDFDYLREIGKRICRETGASRIAVDISRRPPATIELF